MAVDIESTLEHKVTELRKHNPVKGMSARLLRTYCLIHAKYEFSFAYGETCPSPALPPFPKRFYFRRFGLENLPLTLLTLVLTRVLERKAYCNSWLAMQLSNGKVNRSSWIYTTQIGAYPRSLSQLSPLLFLQFVFDDRPHVQLLSSRAPLCPQRRSKKEQQHWWMRRIRAFELLTFKNVILQIYINQQNVP